MRRKELLPNEPLEFIGYFNEDGEIIQRKCNTQYENGWYITDENGKPCYCYLIGWDYLTIRPSAL